MAPRRERALAGSCAKGFRRRRWFFLDSQRDRVCADAFRVPDRAELPIATAAAPAAGEMQIGVNEHHVSYLNMLLHVGRSRRPGIEDRPHWKPCSHDDRQRRGCMNHRRRSDRTEKPELAGGAAEACEVRYSQGRACQMSAKLDTGGAIQMSNHNVTIAARSVSIHLKTGFGHLGLEDSGAKISAATMNNSPRRVLLSKSNVYRVRVR